MQAKTALTVFAVIVAFAAHAVPTSAEQAVRVVDNWLVNNPALGCALGASAEGARTLETAGGARFHVVRLQGGGFVIVSGDTSVEPIVAFSPSKDLVESADNPLYRLLDGDLSRRPLRSVKFAAAPGAATRVLSSEEAKWASLLGDSGTDGAGLRKVLKTAGGKWTISDCRVAPLLSTEWSQGGPRNTVGETALCYNYYTPNHYPCGCVATACAQIMYYHRQPASDFDWSLMVDKPARGISDAGAQAIGRLTADIGLICGAEYYPGGASLGGYMIAPLLTRHYGYGSAIAFQTMSEFPVSDIMAAVIPNLDAKLPVALGLVTGFEGHEVVADGYGYDYGTFYLHVNMGWAGMDDAWYAPPAVGEYSFIDGIVCNIDPKGSLKKTLVSGRVLDASTGAPVAGAEVSADGATVVSDVNGIYALALEPGKRTVVAVFGSQKASAKITVTANVGTEVDFASGMFYSKPSVIANQYGVDLTLAAGGDEPVGPQPSGGDPLPSTMSGAVLSADGSVVGVVQLKVGKANKQGLCKVSPTLIGRDGKKYTAKAVDVPVGGQRDVVFEIKKVGSLMLSLNAEGLEGTLGEQSVVSVSDEPPVGPAAVALTLDEELPIADVLTEYLPTDVVVERTAKKWTLPKAGKLKYVKANPKKGIEAGLVATGENIAGLKLTYTAKTQTVKGSFKIWTFDEEKKKLKSVSASVTGVVVGGVAYCDVTVKKQKIGELVVE